MLDKRKKEVMICGMYIRTKTTPLSNKISVQIVEGIRTGEKVKQKIVRHVGIAEDEQELEKLKDLGREIIAKLTARRINEARQMSLFEAKEEEILVGVKGKRGRKARKNLEDILPPSEVSLDDVKEQERIVEGIHEVGNAVYDLLGYDKLLPKKEGNRLRDLVLTRLAHPASKHKTQRILSKEFGKEHDLDALYRLMDKVYDKIAHIKSSTFESTSNLFPGKVDLVLFDVTTLYFETTEADDLRRFGYSKDCKFNTTQVVLALATNEDGLPISYELFEGNKAEVKTLMESIENWKKLFEIGSVYFIADRAMFTRENLKLLDERGYGYIVAAKLRSLPEAMKGQVLNEENYSPTVLKNEFAWINELDYEGKRLIVSYKKHRALKDQKERDQVLSKLERLIGKKSPTSKLITNQGVRKYTKTDKGSKTMIDEEKVALDAAWDGLHGIITNITEEAAETLIARYAKLWIIEESFRIKKHLLKIRPIFHWKPSRIHAHVAICYMAFAVLRHLQYRVALTQKISPEIIIEELSQVQASIHMHKRTKDLYRLPGHFSNIARKIYKAIGVSRSLDATVYFR